MSDHEEVMFLLKKILEGQARMMELFVLMNTKPKRPQPSMDPAWDKSPEEIARIQALPNHSRIPSKPGFERDYTAYHAADTVYPRGRQV